MSLNELSLREALLLAAVVGIVGPVVAGLSTRALGQRRLFLDLLRTRASISEEQVDGPFARAFAPFVRAGSGGLPLSPDAIAAAVRDSLAKSREAALSRLRPWSYLPLLAGLLITAISLRRLLELTVGGGSGNMAALTGEMGQALLGTVAGVTASLLASLVQVAWASRIDGAASAAEQYLFQVFVPSLPSVRVKLQFDQEVMEVLVERTTAVVEAYREALQPLVDPLVASASSSAAAATVAQAAFLEVAAAVKGARGLKDACAQLAAAADYSERTATALSQQVAPIRELIERSSEQAAAATGANQDMAKGIGELTTAVTALKAAVIEGPLSISTATAEISASLKRANAVIGQVATASESVGTEVGVLREAVANLGKEKIELWGSEVRQILATIQKDLRDGIAGIPASTAQEMDRLGASASGAGTAVLSVRNEVLELDAALANVAATVGRLERRAPDRDDPRVTATPGVDVAPLLNELRTATRQIQELLASQRQIHGLLASRLRVKRRLRWPFAGREA